MEYGNHGLMNTLVCFIKFDFNAGFVLFQKLLFYFIILQNTQMQQYQ